MRVCTPPLPDRGGGGGAAGSGCPVRKSPERCGLSRSRFGSRVFCVSLQPRRGGAQNLGTGRREGEPQREFGGSGGCAQAEPGAWPPCVPVAIARPTAGPCSPTSPVNVLVFVRHRQRQPPTCIQPGRGEAPGSPPPSLTGVSGVGRSQSRGLYPPSASAPSRPSLQPGSRALCRVHRLALAHTLTGDSKALLPSSVR